MMVLGIDPGLSRLGYGIVARENGAMRFCDAGVFTTPTRLPVPQRLAMIVAELETIMREHKPDRIILERVFPTPRASLHHIGEVRGVVLAVAGRHAVPVEEVSPTTLKALTVRSGHAAKMQVRKTVQRMLGLKELPRPDAADALALAILGSGGPL